MTASFEQIYGRGPDVRSSAAGRVNLMGEHTDYNDGFVLPAAIPRYTHVELARRDDTMVRVWSDAYAIVGAITFPLDASRRSGDWADYVRGMVWSLAPRGITRGADLRLTSDLPIGSGLSSSAALLIAVGRALREAFDLAIDDVRLAIEARRAEVEFVGAPVGIMDQMACSLAGTGHALFLDTRSLEFERVPLPSGCALLVIDSGVRHRHASGDYLVRRAECERAAERLGVGSLRDLGDRDMDRVAALPAPLDRRVRHVVTENARVLRTVEALRAGDLARAGALFVESHASMRDDFDVSIPEVDALVEAARGVRGVYGARLTGGGFGGAIVALADRAQADELATRIVRSHNVRFPTPAAVVCLPHS